MRSAMVPGTSHDRCKGWRGRAPARICKTAIGPGRMHGTKGESRRRHPSEPPNGPEDVRPDARRGAGLSQSVSGWSCANDIEWLWLLLLLALPVTGDEEKAPDSANPAAVALLPCQRRLWALSPGCPARASGRQAVCLIFRQSCRLKIHTAGLWWSLSRRGARSNGSDDKHVMDPNIQSRPSAESMRCPTWIQLRIPETSKFITRSKKAKRL